MDARNTCASKPFKAATELGLEQIGLWQLHAIDPKVPRESSSLRSNRSSTMESFAMPV